MKTVDGMLKPIEISKELERINYKELITQFPELKRNKKEVGKITRHKNHKRWFLNSKVYPANKKKDNEPKTQLEAFQQAMQLLLIAGQCLGLNPIAGVLVADITKIRFSVFSWRFVYCFTIGLSQASVVVLTLKWLTKINLTIASVGFFAFYLTTCITTFLFLHLGTKWPALMRELAGSSLNEYIDRSVKFKCYIACIVIFTSAIVEHILSLLSKLSGISACSPDVDLYIEYQKKTFAWYYDLGLPYNKACAIIIQMVNIIATLNWSYSDVYICSLSFYLVSILQKINKKIKLASEKHFLPEAYWRSLREDYCKATRLVRSFDDVISGIIFSSFASNLLFICLQLFNVLKYGFKIQNRFDNSTCLDTKNGVFGGNEYTVYVGYSVTYLLSRSLAVALIAACVHSASLLPATALYNVPSPSFCPEVTRLLDQVHSDTVALSGLHFFYVTRELVLSVVGTIVTYELVVLQVSGNETTL